LKSSTFLRRLFQNWPVKVLSLAAAVLLVVFNNISRLEERFFSVPLHLQLPEDYVPAAQYPDKVRVSLRGQSDDIFRIMEDDIHAYLDLTDHPNEGMFKVPVRIEKTGAALNVEPLEIKVEPMDVAVELEKKLLKSVEVTPTLTGFPPPGYELGQYTVSPSSVEMGGPRSKVQDAQSVKTEDIDLAGRREDFSVRVRLVKPDPLISFPGGDVVEFRGIIEESVVLQTFQPVEVVVLDLDPQLTIASPLPEGSVRVQGRQLDLEKVTPDQVQIVVDASQVRRPGTYNLSARPAVPRGLLVLRYEPSQIQVRIVRAEQSGGDAP